MPKKKTVNAIALLKADHRAVEKLFAAFEKAKNADRKKSLAEEICLQLRVHATIEEDIFYPACREGGVDEDMMDEAIVEHDAAKVLITEIEQGGPEDQFYDAKVKVLSEQIKHHVKEEEKKQGNIFAKARKADLDLGELGERMAAEKKEALAKLKAGPRPKPPTQSLASTRLSA